LLTISGLQSATNVLQLLMLGTNELLHLLMDLCVLYLLHATELLIAGFLPL
jgi:hypothetical protein